MAFLFCLIELLLMFHLALDTLGFIVHHRIDSEKSSLQDYKRLCFNWAFILGLRYFLCLSCSGYLGNLICMITLLLKAYLTVPLLNGTEKMYKMVVEENMVTVYAKKAVNTVQEKMGNKETESGENETPK